jgi:hypothetical protein
MIMKRANYLDGSSRTLLRGCSLICMTIVIIILIACYSTRLTPLKSWSIGLILMNYIFASTLHSGIAHDYEMYVTVLDHMSIHGHILATIFNLHYSDAVHYAIYSLFGMSVLIDCINMIFKTDYISSFPHYRHYAIGFLLALLNYALYLVLYWQIGIMVVPVLLGITYAMYCIALAIYYFLITKSAVTGKIWSHYETYHLLIVLGTLGNILYIFNFIM